MPVRVTGCRRGRVASGVAGPGAAHARGPVSVHPSAPRPSRHAVFQRAPPTQHPTAPSRPRLLPSSVVSAPKSGASFPVTPAEFPREDFGGWPRRADPRPCKFGPGAEMGWSCLRELDREASRAGCSRANQRGAPSSRDAGRRTRRWRIQRHLALVVTCAFMPSENPTLSTSQVLFPVHEQDAEAVVRADA